jgi:hypothetical protein
MRFAFEQCLNNPVKPKTGDEYYWLHQQQLQNSALEFRFCNQKVKTEALELKLSVQENNQASKDSVKIESTTPTKKLLADTQALITNNLVDEFPQFIKGATLLITQGLSQHLSSQDQCKRDLPSKSAPSVLDNALTHKIIFKNHLLFIEANKAELSLNSGDLNKQQIKELSQLLKHWLLTKGIKLQQLVINGVKQ